VNNTQRNIRNIVYRLKRELGVTIVLVTRTITKQDMETGAISKSDASVTIKRAVMLPYVQVKEIYSMVGTPLNVGGELDVSTRFVLIDAKDLADDLEIDRTMHITYDRRQYEIEKIQVPGQLRAWLLQLRDVQSARASE
jgi:hypothetical protein